MILIIEFFAQTENETGNDNIRWGTRQNNLAIISKEIFEVVRTDVKSL